MLIDKYFEYQLDYEKKYGEKTIVLMEVGSFFEIYGVNNEIEKIGDVQRITEILNITLTRRNKAILENSRTNCLMAGFPTVSLKRYLHLLISNNYTIIMVEQVTKPPNPKRKVTNIYSPGTYIEEINQVDPNNIVSIFIQEDKCYKSGKKIYQLGMSSIDLSTSSNSIYQTAILKNDIKAVYEQIYRYIESFNPKEIIINSRDLTEIGKEDILKNISMANRGCHCKVNDVASNIFKLSFINAILKKVFPNHGMLSPIEYLDLERKQTALYSYIILLEFAWDHNEKIIEKLEKPVIWNSEKHLMLYNNSIYQLNVTESNLSQCGSDKYKSLFHVINMTSTAGGRRLLKYRLMNPITNIIKLRERYNLVKKLLDKNKNKKIEQLLNEIIDIERLHRKMTVKMLQPFEFASLAMSNKIILELLKNVGKDQLFTLSEMGLKDEDIKNFNDYISEYNTVFDLTEMSKYSFNSVITSFFRKGIYEEIDEVQNNIDVCFNFFKKETTKLSNILEKGCNFVKIESTDRDGYFFYVTKKRAEGFKKKLPKEYTIKKYTGSSVKLVSDKLGKYSDKLILCKEKINGLTKEYYLKTLASFEDKYMYYLKNITNFIAQLDIVKSSAKNVFTYGYCCPLIKDQTKDQISFFNANAIRHPIIERIESSGLYVTNDINLGGETTGMLLYGVNGTGKSSLSKAVGLTIIMAQAGLYVPCTEFVYYPYNKIFTRISGDDNIFKGQSSFIVEMSELRSILRYSDKNSIVLGDEICKGTEELSALSIVSASIKRFSEKNVNFVLATHFHKLHNLEELSILNNIKFKHLSVSFDKESGDIIYGRKIEDGLGEKLYGLEIAKHIIEDKDFVNNANRIRNHLQNKNVKIISEQVSNYNNNIYMDQCHICGSNDNLDTHHIIFQKNFDKNDLCKHIQKNDKNNLVVLCKKHHIAVHNNEIEIRGYYFTTSGFKLNYKKLDQVERKKKNKSRKKYGTDDINIIMEFKDDKRKMKFIMHDLKGKGFKISQATVKKIWANKY